MYLPGRSVHSLIYVLDIGRVDKQRRSIFLFHESLHCLPCLKNKVDILRIFYGPIEYCKSINISNNSYERFRFLFKMRRFCIEKHLFQTPTGSAICY